MIPSVAMKGNTMNIKKELENDGLFTLHIKDQYYYDNGKIIRKSTGKVLKGYVVNPSQGNRGGPYRKLTLSFNCQKRQFFYHRVVWLLCKGVWPNKTIDHIDGDPMNNLIENLRDVSVAENNANKTKYSKNKTGYKGVTINRVRFRAQINFLGRCFYVGTFDNAFEAAKAYDKKAYELHGDASRLNFPEDYT